ncbi:MAG: peptidoglycan bridge formation glycyltransferase FemA/FemB family protein [Bacteroidia bacterium]
MMEQQQYIAHTYQNKLWTQDLAGSGETVICEEFSHAGQAICFVAIKKKWNGLPFSSFKITFGPVLDYNSEETLRFALEKIKALVKKHRAVSVQVNPFTWGPKTDAIRAIFEEHGFRRVPYYVYEATMMVDLLPDEDAIFSRFENRGREAVRQSQRRGITTSEVPVNDANFAAFYNMYAGTCARTAMIPESAGKIKQQLFHLSDKRLAHLFFAYHDGQPVCAFVAFSCGDCLSLIYQGTDYGNDNQNRRPANGLYWGTIKWAKEQGFRWFDLAGVNARPEAGSKSEGIRLYKRQFGGEYMELPGNFEFVNRPVVKKLIDLALPLYSAFALRRARRKIPAQN